MPHWGVDDKKCRHVPSITDHDGLLRGCHVAAGAIIDHDVALGEQGQRRGHVGVVGIRFIGSSSSSNILHNVFKLIDSLW